MKAYSDLAKLSVLIHDVVREEDSSLMHPVFFSSRLHSLFLQRERLLNALLLAQGRAFSVQKRLTE